MSEGEKLARFSHVVRDSTLRRLQQVPAGQENWRHASYALSFAEMAQHLLNMDEWLFRFLEGELPPRPQARAGSHVVSDRSEYEQMLAKMKMNQTQRQQFMAALSDRVLSMPVYMEDRDMVVPLQTLVVADYLQHEIRQWDRLAATQRALEREKIAVIA